MTVRVLVVDDAAIARQMVTRALGADPGIEVVGSLGDGRRVLERIEQLRPHVVVLDVEMPMMDGLQTLAAIRQRWPDLGVIMFSTFTERGARVTLDALMQGANDYIAKPSTGPGRGADVVLPQLVERVKALGRERSTEAATPGHEGISAAAGPPARVDLVVVGVSTGGPTALATMLPELPADLPVPVLVVQHMPPMFTAMLAERLDLRVGMRVREAVHQAPAMPGEVWIAPGDHHLQVHRGPDGLWLALDQGPPENSCRPSVDVLFRSAARTCASHVLAAVLTGMGQDGLKGAREIAAAGGTVIAQDEASSVVWGMPGAIARNGLATDLLPPAELGRAITAQVLAGRARVRPATARWSR